MLQVGPIGFSAEEAGLLSPPQRALLANLTAFGLVVADGHTEELVAPFVERESRSLMLQRLAMEVAVEEAGMDEDALREAYSRSPQPELVVRHLVVLSERWRPEAHHDSARDRAVEALERARSGEPFEAVVAEYSDEPGAAERGGLLDAGREGSWVPEFWAAASSLREGELSDVVQSEYGFHVIRLEERRAVPFEDVRDDVLERFVDLPAALSRAQDWAAARAASLRIDTAAIEVWRDGRDGSAGLLAGTRQGEAENAGQDAVPLVQWPGEDGPASLTAAELETYLSTQGPDVRRQAMEADLPQTVAMVAAAAQTRLLADRARRRGLDLSIAQRAALDRRWANRIALWAETFGFTAGMGPGAVKVAALEALGSSQQTMMIARRELSSIAGVLGAMVPVSAPAQSASSADAVNSDSSA